MITVHCDKCRKELEYSGALVFSRPINWHGTMVVIKYHVCDACWKLLEDWLK